jgi:ABC-2 type transport system ATP-binding protein
VVKDPVLSCRDVTKSFGSDTRGIFDFSLEVQAGTSFAILGPNGSGKTTLMNLCLGYLQADRGTIRIAGVDIARNPVEAKLKLAYVPEVARLYPHLSALQHLHFFDSLLPVPPRREQHERVLGELGMSADAMRDRVGTYSKGMRQKVAIALGLLKGAELFLLDEPASGLDALTRAELVKVINRLRGQGKAILFSSHDLTTVQETADQVVLLRDGRAVQQVDSSAFDPALAWSVFANA